MKPIEPLVPKGMGAIYDHLHIAPAVKVNGFLICGGQIGMKPDGTVLGGLEAQAELAFELIGQVLEAGGATYADVVELNTFHIDIQETIQRFLAVKERFFVAPYPVWTAVGVVALAVPGALVEIKATARLRA